MPLTPVNRQAPPRLDAIRDGESLFKLSEIPDRFPIVAQSGASPRSLRDWGTRGLLSKDGKRYRLPTVRVGYHTMTTDLCVRWFLHKVVVPNGSAGQPAEAGAATA